MTAKGDWLRAGEFTDWLTERVGEAEVSDARHSNSNFDRRWRIWLERPWSYLSAYTADEYLIKHFGIVLDDPRNGVPSEMFYDADPRAARAGKCSHKPPEFKAAVLRSISDDNLTPEEAARKHHTTSKSIRRWMEAAA